MRNWLTSLHQARDRLFRRPHIWLRPSHWREWGLPVHEEWMLICKILRRTVLLLLILAAIVWAGSIDWAYSHIISLDCGGEREIHIYVHSWCDVATIPVYEVTDGEKLISAKYSTRLSFECGDTIHPHHFKSKWDDTKTVVAVTYHGQLALVYDFGSSQGWPGVTIKDEAPAGLLDRLNLSDRN